MQDLKQRTKKLALACWLFCRDVPKSREYDAWARQLIRCSASVGANYRAAQRAKSTADFLNKLKIVEEEADETIYWLELFVEVIPERSQKIEDLLSEANQVLSIIVASIKTVKKNM